MVHTSEQMPYPNSSILKPANSSHASSKVNKLNKAANVIKQGVNIVDAILPMFGGPHIQKDKITNVIDTITPLFTRSKGRNGKMKNDFKNAF